MRGGREPPSPTPPGRRRDGSSRSSCSASSTRSRSPGLLTAWAQEAWGYTAVLAVTLVALNVVYLPRRYVPMKYLLPGLFFLAVFGDLPGAVHGVRVDDELRHRLRADARTRRSTRSRASRSARSRTRRRSTPPRCAAPDGAFAGYALYDPETEELSLGTTEGIEPLDGTAELQVLTDHGQDVRRQRRRPRGRAARRPRHPARVPGRPGDVRHADRGRRQRDHLRRAGVRSSRPVPVRPRDATSIVDTETGTVFTPVEGQFTAPDGTVLLARVPDQRRVRQLPRDLHRARVPRGVPARAGVEHRLRRRCR